MFKNLLICAVVSASVIGCSTTAPARPDSRTAAAALCPQNTASRIPMRPGEWQCSSTPGRTYSNEEIERTGQTNVGEALQMLDPSISVHH
jgi:hypothetical protein